MKSIVTEVQIAAPAARVWQILTDLDRYAEWNPLIRHAGGAVVQGAFVDLDIQPEGLSRRRAAVELLRVDPCRELRWRGRLLVGGLLDGDHSFLLRPVSERSVTVVQKEDFSGLLVPFVAPVLVPRMRAAFERMNQALKARAESA